MRDGVRQISRLSSKFETSTIKSGSVTRAASRIALMVGAAVAAVFAVRMQDLRGELLVGAGGHVGEDAVAVSEVGGLRVSYDSDDLVLFLFIAAERLTDRVFSGPQLAGGGFGYD